MAFNGDYQQLARPRSTRLFITLCMTPRLTKRSTHHELALRCLGLMLNESVRSSTVRNSLKPRIAVFVALTSLTMSVLPMKVIMLPSSSLQTIFFQSFWHLRQPVRQSARPILPQMPFHEACSAQRAWCARACVYVWCAWCAQHIAHVVRASVCVCVVRRVRAAFRAPGGARVCLCVCVHVVHAAHRAHGTRARVCVCCAHDARSAPHAWCARARVCVCVCVCGARGTRGAPRVCVWCAWHARRTACVLRVRVCVCVVRVVRAAFHERGARVCVCLCGL